MVVVLALFFMVMLVAVRMAMFVDVFMTMLVGVIVGVLMLLLLRDLRAIEDEDLGGGDAAAVDLFDLERSAEVERGDGVVEDLRGDSGVEQSAEEHVSADAGKAVEVGDAHEPIVSRWS